MPPMTIVAERTRRKLLLIAASSVFLPASLAVAQNPATTPSDDEWKRRTEQRLQDLEKTVRQKDAEIENLQRQVSGVAETQAAVRRDAEARGQWMPTSVDPAAADETTTPPFFDVNKFAAKGDFPGSIRIPGTKTSVQIGGFAQVDALFDFDRIGSRDNFVTNTIPTDIEGAGQTNFSARQTRLFIKTVTPNEGWGPLTTYVEGDFFGSNNAAELRLRHAYGEIGKNHRLLGGQTWSTFVDASVFPAVLDQEARRARCSPAGLSSDTRRRCERDWTGPCRWKTRTRASVTRPPRRGRPGLDSRRWRQTCAGPATGAICNWRESPGPHLRPRRRAPRERLRLGRQLHRQPQGDRQRQGPVPGRRRGRNRGLHERHRRTGPRRGL